ncbi:hypothetical protein NMG60_11036526 [Bertholletia excelsa]
MAHNHANVQSTPHWVAITSSSRKEDQIIIPARSLNIVWGNDSRYWQWDSIKDVSIKQKGFDEAAVLLQVNWLAVTGKIDPSMAREMKPDQDYQIFYVIKFRADAFGWHSAPVKFRVRVDGKDAAGQDQLLESCRSGHLDDQWLHIPAVISHFTFPNRQHHRGVWNV